MVHIDPAWQDSDQNLEHLSKNCIPHPNRAFSMRVFLRRQMWGLPRSSCSTAGMRRGRSIRSASTFEILPQPLPSDYLKGLRAWYLSNQYLGVSGWPLLKIRHSTSTEGNSLIAGGAPPAPSQPRSRSEGKKNFPNKSPKNTPT